MSGIGWVLVVLAIATLAWLLRDRLFDLAMRVSIGTNMVTIRPSRNGPTRTTRRRARR